MDPIQQLDDGIWIFWDETQAGYHGPYETEDEARAALKRYIEGLG